MKVLVDECANQRFRRPIVGHEVYTAGYMGWDGPKNGRLLAAAAAAGFSVMVTRNRSLEYTQNLKALPPTVVVLRDVSNDLQELMNRLPNHRSRQWYISRDLSTDVGRRARFSGAQECRNVWSIRDALKRARPHGPESRLTTY